MSTTTREKVEAALEAQEWNRASAELKSLFGEAPTLANAQYVLKTLSKLPSSGVRPCARLFFLRSFTVEPVLPLLQASAALYGVQLETQTGDFNAYAQEILNPDSALYRYEPHIVVLAVQTRDLIPDLWTRFPDLSEEEAKQVCDTALSNLRNWIGLFRSRSQAHLIIHNLEKPELPSAGTLDAQSQKGQSAILEAFNQELIKLAAEQSGVFVLDYDGLVARHGRKHWHDERKWLTMRMPIAADCLIHLANEYLHFVLPLTGKVCKTLVVDLDNTLWGGVIGEDGMHGIKLGKEYPGAAYKNLHRALLDLSQRGILLAVCSKNNPADALEAIEQHPEMMVRSKHFAAVRINWQDKAQNLREIAAELNIGIDSLAFLDDNPAERERIRVEIPEVTVLDFPTDILNLAEVVRLSPVFSRLNLSREDRERGRYYAEQRQRTELQQSAGSLEDYYRSLKQEAILSPVGPATLARVAQLTQKTNQFNLTTRRYSEQQIEEMGQNSDWRVYSIAIKDTFGDNGLVGIAILHRQDTIVEIDTLLLSCRVIGRTVETAFLSFLARKASAMGGERLEGWFLPTKKNVPAKDFYSTHGFQVVKETEEGTLWALDLRGEAVDCPEWISLVETDHV